MKYIPLFLDTETTGNQSDDRLCQVAYEYNGDMHVSLFKPPKSIPPEASAVCHITNKMVADKEPFQGSEYEKALSDILAKDSTVLVAHNAQFDVGMLEAEGLQVSKYICTMKVARALDPKGIIPKYNLQYLRYYLDIEIEAIAHDAQGDVLVLVELFKRLKAKMMANGLSEDEAMEEMIRISQEPSMILRITFGKYSGLLISEVAEKDMGYLEWLLNSKLKEPDGQEDWIYTLKKFIEG